MVQKHHFPKWHSMANSVPSPPVIGAQAPEGGEKAAGCLPQGEVGAQVPSYSTVHSAGELTWGVDETLAQLEKVLHLYRSGQYLQNSTEGGRAGEWPRLGSRGWGGGEQVRGWVIPLIGEVAHPPSETHVECCRDRCSPFTSTELQQL